MVAPQYLDCRCGDSPAAVLPHVNCRFCGKGREREWIGPIQRQSSAAFGPRYFASKGDCTSYMTPCLTMTIPQPCPASPPQTHTSRPDPSYASADATILAHENPLVLKNAMGTPHRLSPGRRIRRGRARRCRQGSRRRTAAAPSTSLQRFAAAWPADTGDPGLMVINASVEGAANSTGHPSCGASPASARREQSPHPGSDPR